MTNKCLKMAVKEEGIHNLSFPKVVAGNIGAALYPRQKPSRMTNAARGFTLIELLVVVLIIGILASVALPQYNKAVRKARLSEVATTFNSISKAIDMYVLENGYPSSEVYLSGDNPDARLDIAQTCASVGGYYCYTKVGAWWYRCDDGRCEIYLYVDYNADKTSGNKWLTNDNIGLHWFRVGDGQWGMDEYGMGDGSTKKEICRWWAGLYGKDRVLASSGTTGTTCNAYL